MKIEESYDDFTRKYESCYFKIDKPTPKLFRFSYIDSGCIIGRYITKELSDEVAIRIEDFESSFAYPELGVINFVRNVAYLQRSAVRQWKRCLCFGGNRLFTEVPLAAKVSITVNAFDESPKALTSVFYPTYFNDMEAFKKISSGNRISAAITNHFYVGVNGVLPFIYLGYKSYCVGKVEEGEYTLFPRASHLYEELSYSSTFNIVIQEFNL